MKVTLSFIKLVITIFTNRKKERTTPVWGGPRRLLRKVSVLEVPSETGFGDVFADITRADA